MRTIVLTTPFTKGEDVRQVQRMLNQRTPNWVRSDLAVDGEYGPATGSMVAVWKRYVAGYPEKMLAGGRATGIGERGQRWLADPKLIPVAWRMRASRRRSKLLGDRKKAADLVPVGDKAVTTMLAWARTGLREVPDGSNVVPALQPLAREQGCPAWIVAMGYPWCAMSGFLAAAIHGGTSAKDGIVHYEFNGLYTVSLLAEAQAARHGMRVVGQSQAQRGDIVLFNWPGGDARVDHMARLVSIDRAAGTLVTVDGNIGNRVGVHERPIGLVRAFIRDT